MLLNKQLKFFLIITQNPVTDAQKYRYIDNLMYKEYLVILSIMGLINFGCLDLS